MNHLPTTYLGSCSDTGVEVGVYRSKMAAKTMNFEVLVDCFILRKEGIKHNP